MNSDTPIKLMIPHQDLRTFSLFQLNADAAHTWAQGLPVTNTLSVVQQLLSATGDLNRITLAPEIRYNILEALYPSLNVALSNLSRRFFNQPLVMPLEPRRMAELAHRLHSALVTAYSIVAIETLQQRENVRGISPAYLVCLATQRALEIAGRKVLQTLQLHRPIEINGWLTLHQLYALAERQGLAGLPVRDTLSRETTIAATYLQTVMLGCCKPNQLYQSDLAAIYRGLQDWSSIIRLESPGSGKGLFLVDLDSDQPPLYGELCGSRPGEQCRQIDTAPLITRLEQLKAADDEQGKPGISLEEGMHLPSSMLAHLIDSLGSMNMRNFNRTGSGLPLSVSVGLSSAHYHAAGARTFEQLLYGDEYFPLPADRVSTNLFLQVGNRQAGAVADVGQNLYKSGKPGEGEATLAAQEYKDLELSRERQYPVYQVQMANASPNGYCLDWPSRLPGNIRAGDIVSVQEEHSEEWAIAVIRWMSQLEEAKTLIGLELLGPAATAYGAQIHRKMGDKAAPMRVLLLPEIKLVGQPHTLITPRAGFKERQKITLLREGEELTIQLVAPDCG